jgi:hypothetical protein
LGVKDQASFKAVTYPASIHRGYQNRVSVNSDVEQEEAGAGYSIFWFIGSAAIGILYDVSLPAVIAFCMITQFTAVPIFIWVGRRQGTSPRT